MAFEPGLYEEWASIDPGVEYLAVAFWEGPRVRNTLVMPLVGPSTYGRHWTTVVEKPRIMPGRKVRARDIEGVLRAYGRLEERLGANLVPMDPHSVPEKIWHARIKSKLSPAELKIVESLPKTQQKHTIDAVGLGLKFLGRL